MFALQPRLVKNFYKQKRLFRLKLAIMFSHRLLVRFVFIVALCFSLVAPHAPSLATITANTAPPLQPQSHTSMLNFDVAQLLLQETVGLDAGCAPTSQISILAGSIVTFCFRITNTGNTTFTTHSLTDALLGKIHNGISMSLPPGQAYVVTRTLMITQSVNTNSLWEANGPGGSATAQSGNVIVSVQQPQIAFAHTVGLPNEGPCSTNSVITITLDTPIVHCFTITNTGPISLTKHQITDSVMGLIEGNLQIPLSPGMSTFITRTESPTANSVYQSRWSASNGVVTASATSSAAVNVIQADITLEQTVGVDPGKCAVRNSIDVGQNTPVIFCYVVRNTGSIPLNLHELTDTDSGTILSNLAYTLNPGASGFITRTATLNQSVVNRATWVASNGTVTVRASSTATVTVQPAAVIMSMGVGYNQFDCLNGNSIIVQPYTNLTFCYGIRNSGSIPLSIHTITDDKLGVVYEGLNHTIAPGATMVVTKSATVVQTNKHIGTWHASNGTLTTTSSAFANVEVTPISLALFVTVGADGSENCASTSSITVAYNTRVTYCYTIRNISGISLTQHNLNDTRFGQILTDLPYVLSPGMSAFITTTVPATRTMVNTATWTATDGRATAIAEGSASVRVFDQVIFIPEIFNLASTR